MWNKSQEITVMWRRCRMLWFVYWNLCWGKRKEGRKLCNSRAKRLLGEMAKFRPGAGNVWGEQTTRVLSNPDVKFKSLLQANEGIIWLSIRITEGFPRWLSGKESTCQCRRHGFDLWAGKIPWRKKWQANQFSCLENPMERGTWWTTVHGVVRKSDTI